MNKKIKKLYIRIIGCNDFVKARMLSINGMYSFHTFRPSSINKKLYEGTETIIIGKR